MAKIEFGQIVSGIRGRAGGIVWSANAAGPYLKPLRIPYNPDTEDQQDTRTNWALLTKSFSPLPSATRELWDQLADQDPEPSFDPFGNRIPHSGISYFVKCNRRRHLLNLEPLTEPPTGIHAARPDPSAGFTIATNSVSQENLTIGFIIYPTHPDLLFRIDTILTNNPYSPPPERNYTFTTALPTNTGSANIFPHLTQKYGPLAPGLTFWVRSAYLCPYGIQSLQYTQAVTLNP